MIALGHPSTSIPIGLWTFGIIFALPIVLFSRGRKSLSSLSMGLYMAMTRKGELGLELSLGVGSSDLHSVRGTKRKSD